MKRPPPALAVREEKASAMSEVETSREPPRPTGSRVGRWLLAAAGVVSVALAALGAVLPGLPTTIFLIVASWCFARSCPWLEERLVRTPLFRPFLGYLDGARMPLRAVVVTLAVMWTAVAVSTAALLGGDTPRPLVAAIVVIAAAVGSVFVVRLRARGAGAPASRQRDLAPTDA
ncbi:MAG: YbaN family protein [Acidobacteriota bacterium]